MRHRVVEELNFVLTFVGAVWAVFLVDVLLPVNLNAFGLAPRQLWGLVGIVTMPFLHGGWAHLLGNTVPLVAVLCLLAGSRANTFRVVFQIVVLGGALLWLLGRGHSIHVGASGLIYGLIAFLIVAGISEGRLGALAIALLVGATYGTTLLTGVLPISVGANVSWDGHLAGAVAGAVIGRTGLRTHVPPSSNS